MPGVLSKELGMGLLAGAGIAAISFLGAYAVLKANAPKPVAATHAHGHGSGAAAAGATDSKTVLITPPALSNGTAAAGTTGASAAFGLAPPALTRGDSAPLSPMGSSMLGVPPSTPSVMALTGVGLTPGMTPLSAAADPGVLQLRSEIAAVAADRDRLHRMLRLAEASNVETASKGSGVPGLSLMSPSEIETLRGIFNVFDVKQEGKISVGEVKALHAKLGEPLTDAEAAATVKSLDRDGSGVVTFDKFLLWWYENHKMAGKKGDAYTARFKLLSAKLHSDGKEKFDLSRIVTKPAGEVGSTDYRLHFWYKQNNGSLRPLSCWHDVPLHHLGSGKTAQIFNFVCEIPKWTRAKFEIATGEPFNPIKQDTKHGKLRFQKYGDYMVNYGAFPQTWEDPKHESPETKHRGDNDPIDVCEIGTRQLKTGAIVPVKILGIIALIDDGETDWKVIAIQISDPLAHLLNDIDDVDQHLPGALDAIRTYLRDYKSGDGITNNFALGGQAMPRAFATRIVEECHEHWRTLHVDDGKSTV